MKRMLLVAALILGAADAAATEADPGESFAASFVVGEYAVIGRAPGSAAAYSGTARIESGAGGLVMTRTIGGRTTVAAGAFEVPQPPGEGIVLRFRWPEEAPRVMTCLVHGDLDNNARLTCTWLDESGKHAEPGIEALFPTASWEPCDCGAQVP